MTSKNRALILFLLVLFMVIPFSLSKRLPIVSSASSSSYVGAEVCGTCHADQLESWEETNHANAIMLIQNASGNFYSIGSTSNKAGTPGYVMNETSFAGSCRDCHTTGGNNFDPLGANQTWPEMDTDPGKFLNIQCEVCHGAGTEQPWGEASMVIDYSATLCELCHQPGSSHDNSYWQSAHAQSLLDLLDSGHASDFCLSCMSAQGALGLDVTLETPNLESVTCAVCHDPHEHTYEAQLRYEESTELCGQCHSQAELFEESAHDKAGLECASCHGQGTQFAHGRESEIVNHTWALYGTYYPYNQSITEEPIVCSSCHTQSWATSQLDVIQTLTTEVAVNITEAIDRAKAAITLANQTDGVNIAEVNTASDMVESAEDALSTLERDGSDGFHNPEETQAILSDSFRLVGEAESTALQARSAVLASKATDLGTQVLTLQSQVTSLQDQTTTLQEDITSLEAKIDTLESSSATGPYLFGGIGLAIGFIIGAAIIFLTRRGKP